MSLNKADLMSIPLKYFGLPEERKFPMHDETHLKSAVVYFHTVDKKKRKQLADNIIKRHKQLNSNIKITKKNPLFQYVPEDMKNLKETDVPLYTLQDANIITSIIDNDAKSIVESLLNKKDLENVDDLDSAVPDDYVHKNKLLGTLKSVILNEDNDYPLMYPRYTAETSILSKNNGGIVKIKDFSLVNYNNRLNECSELNPVNEVEHIQFCALLREWDQLYMNGHRNSVYDHLMIESWRSRVNNLMEAEYDPQIKQKALDLGINYNPVSKYKFDPLLKAAELGFDSVFNIKKDVIDDKLNSYDEESAQDNDTLTPSITIKLISGSDGHMHQKGVDRTFDYEKYY